MAKTPEENLVEDGDKVMTDNDGSGRGSMVPGPVATGDAHANRPQDQGGTDADTAFVRGQDISRSAMISAIVGQLVGMDNADLSQIWSSIDDANAPGAAAAPLEGDQGKNLASISTKEDVEELLSGEELSEEFKAKAGLIFEAAVQARIAAERVAIEEAAEAKLEESISEITEQLVDQMDKYLTFAAESFVAEHKEQIEDQVRSELAESFVADVNSLVEKYKIQSDPVTLETTAKLQEQIEALEAKLNESVEREAGLAAAAKVAEQKAIFAEAAEFLTPIQRDRFTKLSESVEFDTAESYRARIDIIKESVSKKPGSEVKDTVITENAMDGVPAADSDTAQPKSQDAHVRSVLSALRRTIA